MLQKEPSRNDMNKALTEQSESYIKLSGSKLEEVPSHQQIELKSDSPARPKTTMTTAYYPSEVNTRQDDVKHQISLKYD